MRIITVGQYIVYDQGWFVHPFENVSSPVWVENAPDLNRFARLTPPPPIGENFHLKFNDDFLPNVLHHDPLQTVFQIDMHMVQTIMTVNGNRRLAPWDIAGFAPNSATAEEAAPFDPYKAVWSWLDYWVAYGLRKYGQYPSEPLAISFSAIKT